MGVPQSPELQPSTPSNLKYVYLQKDPIVAESTPDTPLREGPVPKLSVLSFFTYRKYERELRYEPSIMDDLSTDGGIGIGGSGGFQSNEYPTYAFDTSSNSSAGSSGGGSAVSSDDDSGSEKEYRVDITYLSPVVEKEVDLKLRPQYRKPFDSTIYPYSPVHSDTTFSILVAVVCIFALVYAFIVGPLPIIFAFLVSILIIVSYSFLVVSRTNKWYLVSITFLAVGLGLTIPSFFEATGKVVLGLDLSTWDQQLLHGDTLIMGWIFPLGQMGLFVDRSNVIGPDSFVGELSTEIFQLSYISYYIWGYAMELYILYKMWRCYRSKNLEETLQMPIWDQRLKMFICTWISSYFIVFSINMIFPAQSPRVFLSDEYVNKLNGFGLAGLIRSKIENAAKGSFGSFPSGHIATSWSIAFAAYKIVPVYGVISGFAAFLITIATMYLRYHYVVDFLAAVPVAFLCLLFGGFYSLSGMRDSIVNTYRSIKAKFSKNKYQLAQ
ncbi:hypothetical protein SAMD00019534_067120 [Acytostelium subglobosum LB1]|uniref:hypothetical protein n=1 Tax=Acytostelium subglobosum LB1 TaxID=1410327 RepID=UPI00064497FA|nr:hypothetical protein SAMD00019534_067120 [Acytostelium subglobosum LB1]GAM23537.1 hypothetical protein SAMD00019534_067120 [Acytostelium subglobosum LB1]|eukprot:XP_012753278.1 hypothetical protein SAMD00019534_067120 [Acytostelium subglobosum LB1]